MENNMVEESIQGTSKRLSHDGIPVTTYSLILGPRLVASVPFQNPWGAKKL